MEARVLGPYRRHDTKKVAVVVVLTFTSSAVNAGPLRLTAQKVVEAAPVEQFVSSCEQGKQDAKLDAGGFGAGFAWGVGLGFTGIVIASARTPQPSPARLAGKDQAYVSCYAPVYEQRVKSKRINGALVGGVIGTLIWFNIFLALYFSGH